MLERGYPDLHDHVEALDKAGLLIVVDRTINKDTEMHPLVRWQFRGGIPEEDRKAFLFTNVTDSKGRRFDIPVLVCGLAGNRAIYSLGMGCAIDEIRDTWIRAMTHPIPPRLVEVAPCHEIVYAGADLLNGHGLDDIPVPISTPGWDNAPYTSSSHFITKDPETGTQNMGNYRGQIKAPDRMGMNTSIELRTGGYVHWLKWKALGKPMPCAVVLGCPPAVSFTAVQKLPETSDELHVTGGLIGGPLNVVRAKTVDLVVPAEAEIVIEGYVSTEFLEPEAPFGESHGHVNLQEYNGYLDVTAITRRRNAVLTSWVSQVTPSESS
ncbi:MAG: UbiD family decarboxylase, partial [Dehalococcoidia bacterium]|nr:UbiD family decarboxylase [Dehalococcoidia bacterium]